MSALLALMDRLAVRARRPDLPRLRALAGMQPGARLLDLGGGTGAVTALLAPGSRAWVLDPNPRKVRHGELARPELVFVCGGAERIPLPDGSCDVVTALMSFHHVPDQRAALAEARRVLAEGGRLVILELSQDTAQARRLARLGRWLGHGAHDTHFVMPQGLAELVRQAGFRDVRHEAAHRGFIVHARR